MSMASLISILIAQPKARPISRVGLCLLLGEKPTIKVIGTAVGIEEAAPLLQQPPDIILLDMLECDEASLEFLKELAHLAENSRIILFTAATSLAEQRRAVSLGAMGLVRHEDTPEALIKAIERVHDGEVWLERALVANVLEEARRTSQNAWDPEQSRIATLTAREHEVIVLICQGKKNQAIAKELFVSEATVRHRLTSIFEKLKVEDRLELVIFAFQHGLAELPR
jgi:two-component system, NarL family, nitrate/nitrite response regulator NarL